MSDYIVRFWKVEEGKQNQLYSLCEGLNFPIPRKGDFVKISSIKQKDKIFKLIVHSVSYDISESHGYTIDVFMEEIDEKN